MKKYYARVRNERTEEEYDNVFLGTANTPWEASRSYEKQNPRHRVLKITREEI